jgi:hypothetical protein
MKSGHAGQAKLIGLGGSRVRGSALCATRDTPRRFARSFATVHRVDHVNVAFLVYVVFLTY